MVESILFFFSASYSFFASIILLETPELRLLFRYEISVSKFASQFPIWDLQFRVRQLREDAAV